MWVLKPLVSGGEEPYYFLVGVDYVVGRKNCAILLRDDQSISRSHAVLSVSHPAANLTQIAKTSLLTLTDTSKYGTFVNEERLHIHSPRILKSGELVTFGLFQSKFRVEYEPLILCSSCLDGPGKTILNQSVQHLGGHVSNSWTEDNTHLVMSSVKVTVKTICAMICCRPIVKPEFFASLTEAIRNRQHLPSPESFSPPIDEPSIRPGELDITVKPERKSIFRGKTFIFLNEKQHKRLSSALTFGGGNAKLLDNSGSNMSLLETPGSCVVDVGVSDSQPMSYSAEKWIEPVMQTLQRKGLRTIPEAEIGLAVIHNSTDIYCNPHRKPDLETYSSSRTTIPGPTLSQSVDMVDMTAPDFSQVTAYVPDTQPSQEHSTGILQWDEHPSHLNSAKRISGEREETGSSQAKFARTEEPNLPFGHQLHITEPILEKRNSEFTSQSTQSECFFENLKTESSAEGSKGSPGGVSEKETTDENVPGKIEFAHEMTTRKKRKDPEDENLKDDMSLSRHEQLGASKRRKIEPEVLSFNVKDESVSEGGTKASTSQVKQESEINQELSAPLKKKSNNNLELLHESENNETLPSKLMLTVFKSLVVSQPGNGGMLVSNAEDSQLKNFKKFRKVVYPGAEEFPKIIGGTDLKAYQTRKSSEMEEWLRQEAEEQSQQAKEETLADDLFSKLMSQNFLQLTIGKTKAILFGPHQKFHVLTLDPIPFRG
ncbi:nibrin isoform X5 [Heptranchias perlo]|uniref:nibrin isoform X5 n=1 Tax=Heptranchias perlo TaxID=212740 RepID=UPI00355AB026